MSCAKWLKRYLFTVYHIISFPISILSWLRFISWSSPLPLLFNWPCVKLPNHIYVLKWYIIHCLIYFGFIECLYMHLFRQVFGGNSRVLLLYWKYAYKTPIYKTKNNRFYVILAYLAWMTFSLFLENW